MHELALSQSIIDLVAASAAREGVRHVTRVVVEIGAGAAVEPEALRFCFDVVAEQTVVEGAALVIDRVPLRMRCQQCGFEHSPPNIVAACPHCGSYERELLAGREMRVSSYDAE